MVEKLQLSERLATKQNELKNLELSSVGDLLGEMAQMEEARTSLLTFAVKISTPEGKGLTGEFEMRSHLGGGALYIPVLYRFTDWSSIDHSLQEQVYINRAQLGVFESTPTEVMFNRLGLGYNTTRRDFVMSQSSDDTKQELTIKRELFNGKFIMCSVNNWRTADQWNQVGYEDFLTLSAVVLRRDLNRDMRGIFTVTPIRQEPSTL